MSRRHQGGRGHRSGGATRAAEAPRRPDAIVDSAALDGRAGTNVDARASANGWAASDSASSPPTASAPARALLHAPTSADPNAPTNGSATPAHAAASHGNSNGHHDDAPAHGPHANGRLAGSDGLASFGQGPVCTAPQLRRFIKSRPYVPMHELRRRFGINGTEDDVTGIDLGSAGRIYVGLPGREGSLLGELLRGGDIGYELSMDPRTPVVIGLYPMRPVARG